LWEGAEFWIDPEIDQGFGLSNTEGIAGFPSGASFKVGASVPYSRVQRAFVRKTVDLGGDTEKVPADQNQFAGSNTLNRLVLKSQSVTRIALIAQRCDDSALQRQSIPDAIFGKDSQKRTSRCKGFASLNSSADCLSVYDRSIFLGRQRRYAKRPYSDHPALMVNGTTLL
jgi:hypothetical protein